jgi:hypothetical protein
VDDFLADEGAGDVVAVAADPRDAGDLREVQVPGVGDPQGPLDDAAVAVVDLDVVRGSPARVLDKVEDGALDAGLVALDEQEVVRVPAAVFFWPGDVFRGLPLGVGRVGGDHRVLQAHGLQQLLDLRGLGCLVGDPVLGDDHLLLVQHRSEQLELPVADAAQPFPVDRDRGQQAIQAARAGQAAQPAADDLVQFLRVQFLDQGADPLLAGRDDAP